MLHWTLCLAVLMAGAIIVGPVPDTSSIASAAERDLPNIIIVMADDQGYQDLGCFGATEIRTPHIDALADKGMKFTSFYSGYCVCSASRASLMTGCYQPRISMPGVLGPRSRVGLHPDEVTIAELLKSKGYATMCVGKWHLGDHDETLPTAQGFDHYYGLPYSNDMARARGWGNDAADLDKIWKLRKWDIYNNHLYRDQQQIESPVNQVTLTDRYTDEAVKFIRANKSRPFFLYLPHTMPHVPLFVGDDRYDPDPHMAYRLTIEHIDWSVGQLTKTLDDLGLAENTWIVYTSDNGPWLSKQHHAGSALPLREGKATTWEGGMRVPTVMRWPARIPAGSETDKTAASIDLLPTIAQATGADLPPHPIDGLNILPLLEDPAAKSPHDTVGYFYYRNHRPEAVRRGPWKMRIAWQGKDEDIKPGRVELYNLDDDISESQDVAGEHPDVVDALKKLTVEYHTKLSAESRPIWRLER